MAPQAGARRIVRGGELADRDGPRPAAEPMLRILGLVHDVAVVNTLGAVQCHMNLSRPTGATDPLQLPPGGRQSHRPG